MATKMLMPLLGQTMEEGTIIKWFKSEGDRIKAGEPLLEVMTDKVNMEVEAPESGVLRKILAQPDDVIPVKDPICVIGSADEPIDDLLAAKPEPAETAEAAAPEPDRPFEVPVAPAIAAALRVFASPSARRVAGEHGVDVGALAGRGTGPGGRIVEKDVLDYLAAAPKATPLAAKIAAELGVDTAGVTGTGIGGKVVGEDVRMAAASPGQAAGIGQIIPFKGMRKAVAQNVALSAQTAVHVTLVAEVDMTECVKLRKSMLPDVESRFGVRISYTDIIVKAVCRAIQDKPIVNSSLEGEQIVVHDRICIGIATAVEGGLVVPVVKDAQAKSIPQISKEIKELVARTRSGQFAAEDFKGGTFTITNLGTYGVDSFTPVITPGQSAILGVCRIVEKPAVVSGAVAVRSMMNLCLSFDHRVMDGAPAAEFLARLREILELPGLMCV
jgi:pyruvate dehydrogenase E2 component (dihydrolipoamide acetyltransferase)